MQDLSLPRMKKKNCDEPKGNALDTINWHVK